MGRQVIRSGLCASLLAAVTGYSQLISAQSLDDYVVTGDAATIAKTRAEISTATAATIMQGCLDYAQERGGTVSVFILSPKRDIVLARRMDGQDNINGMTALWKAQSAVYLRGSTNLELPPAQALQFLKMDLYLVQGGLPIIVDDVMIGAIGVGGWGEEDEPCAIAGLAAAGLSPPEEDAYGN